MLSLCLLARVCSGALIGIDLGTEYIRAAVLRSGRSIEIVLNEQSKRKTPAILSMESQKPISYENIMDIDARIGNSAVPVLHRNRSAVIRGLTEIIGKDMTPELEKHLESRLFDFHFDGRKVNGIEPHIPLALMLKDIVNHAQNQLQEEGIKDAVVAIPAFFTNSQRLVISAAAKLAGLNLLKIIDDKAALAFVYAVEKTSFFAKEPRKVAIVDFGASFFTISAIKFSTDIVTQKGRSTKTLPVAEELGYVWDDTIGGKDFDILIAKHLQQKYGIPNITTLLLEDAQKLKHALTLGETANVTSDVLDQKIFFTRREFEELAKPLFDKIIETTKSLKIDVDSVEFVGAATRITGFQHKMSSILGPVSRSLNSDESIVMGAAYTAASISKSFKIADIVHSPLSTHTVELILPGKRIPVFNNKTSINKVRTARVSIKDVPSIRLEYTSKLPIGCSPLIAEWNTSQYSEQDTARLSLSFGFDFRSVIKVTKAVYAYKEDGSVIQNSIHLKKSFKQFPINKEESKRVITLFLARFSRANKIAEARNALESLMFEVKDSLSYDPKWKELLSIDEEAQIQRFIEENTEWLHNTTDFDTYVDLEKRFYELEELVKPIKNKIEESRSTREVFDDLDDDL